MPGSHIKKSFQYKLMAALIANLSLNAHADTYAPWLTQIGLKDAVMSASNWGRGLSLAIVDTGIKSSSSVFASGQVSNSLSGCAAISFKCSNSFQDDNGHGTALAEIATGYAKYASNTNYGAYKVVAGSVVSVAPDANLIAE